MNLLKSKNTKYLIAAAACTILSSTAHAGGGVVEPKMVKQPKAEVMESSPSVVEKSASSLKKLFTPKTEMAMGHSNNSLEEAILGGKTYAEARYRYEHIDQDGFADEAEASTLRTRLGYTTGKWHDMTGTLEFLNVAEIGSDEYSSASSPSIADPQITVLNQAFVTYTGLADTEIQVGRQLKSFDNQRFFSQSNWRQNDKSYDSIFVTNKSLNDVTATYGYLNKINNPTGSSLDTNSHLINVSYDGLGFAKATGYGYMLDFDDTPANSSATYGLRMVGSVGLNDHLDGLYTAEYARQSDYGDNTSNYDANYYLGELGLACAKSGLTAKVGFESLGNDGANSFQTPLATFHGHNGWADKFATIPVNGLEDLYGKISYTVNNTDTFADGLGLEAIYHIFEAENGGAEYGDEIDAQISKKINDRYKVAVQYSNYTADTFSTDTEKVSFLVGAKF